MTPLVGNISHAVVRSFDVPMGLFLSRRKLRPLIYARAAAYKLCRDLTAMSLPEIGRAFDRDHSTIINGVKRAMWLLPRDADFRERYANAHSMIETGIPLSVEPDPVFVHLHNIFREVAQIHGFEVKLEKREVA